MRHNGDGYSREPGPYFWSNFAQLLRAHRRVTLSVTQAQFAAMLRAISADKVKADHALISKWEYGLVYPNTVQRKAFARLLQKPERDIFAVDLEKFEGVA